MAVKGRIDTLEKLLDKVRSKKQPVRHFLIMPGEDEPTEEIERWKRENPEGLVIKHKFRIINSPWPSDYQLG